MLDHLSRYARRYLGGAGLSSVIALVTLATDWPEPMKAVALCVAAALVALFTIPADSDGDGAPDWLEKLSPAFAKALADLIASGRVRSVKEGLDYIAGIVVRREVGGEETTDNGGV